MPLVLIRVICGPYST